MAYNTQTWQTGEIGDTPMTAIRLNYMEAGIAAGHVTADARPTLTGADPSAILITATALVGIAVDAARADHRHAGPGTAAPGPSAAGDISQAGAQATVARSDHVHGREAFYSATPVLVSPVAGNAGVSASPARGDHAHAVVVGTPVYVEVGKLPASGTQNSVARSDHVHGVSSVVPGTSTFGDTALAGTSLGFARGDHRHKREPDSGWRAPTLLNGWEQYNLSTFKCEYRRVGNTVEIKGLLKFGSLGVNAFVLPVGFRPNGQRIFRTTNYLNEHGGRTDVREDGGIVPSTNHGTTTWVSFCVSFFTDDAWTTGQ